VVAVVIDRKNTEFSEVHSEQVKSSPKFTEAQLVEIQKDPKTEDAGRTSRSSGSQIWCQRVTSDYPSVTITDMSTSWRDGLAFCAIIHHFRPNLIDFASLRAENILENNALAYKVAEDSLGIPSLLDPEDMVDSDIPDKFSIITYVSQFYHLLKDEDDSRSPSLARAALRHSVSDQEGSNDSSVEEEEVNTGVPKSLFTSPKPILSNNKFSPVGSPMKSGVDHHDLHVSLHTQTHLKSPSSGVTVSGVCEEFTRKIQVSQER